MTTRPVDVMEKEVTAESEKVRVLVRTVLVLFSVIVISFVWIPLEILIVPLSHAM